MKNDTFSAGDVVSRSNLPEFMTPYLEYLITFENKMADSVRTTVYILKEFCQYIHYLRRFGTQPKTADEHKDLSLAAMQLSEIYDVTQNEIEGYLTFLDTIAKNGIGSITKKLSALRGYTAYLDRNASEFGLNWRDGDPIRHIKNPASKDAPAVVLPISAVQKLLDNVAGTFAERDRAIIHLIVTTGIRLSEAANLKWKDLNGSTVKVQRGGMVRTLYLTDSCVESLEQYRSVAIGTLDLDTKEDDLPMFLGERSTRHMTPRGIQLRISKAVKSAGLAAMEVSASVLQDTATANLLQQCSDADRPQVMAYLGAPGKMALRRFRHIRSNCGCRDLVIRKALEESGIGTLRTKEVE